MSQAFENFGKYILLEKIAAGGMAEVYLAKSTGAGGINKFLAIKRILPQYSDHVEFIEMFKEEAKIAVNLNHGNVVSIFDFGVEKSQFFLVMEYVEGQNLRQVLNHLKKENRYFSIDQIVFIIKEIAAGLDHAHRCLDGTTGKPLNITHRDMSPQNIMVSFEGELKIVDFGIAKAESQIETTRAGTIKGKFGYMSPEQADGQTVDPRTDIFSLGIVLWELLANDRLFVSNSEAATLRKIRECQIPSLKKLNPAVPPELERIVNKALAKDKSLRYQTASAFHRDLNRFLNTQYPEFSAHDFSLFMKSCFAQMFMSNRKKLIDYAKAKVSESGENTMMTTTHTETETGAEYSSSNIGIDPDAQLDLAPTPSTPVDLSGLNKKVPTKKPSFYNDNIDRARVSPGHTKSRYRIAKQQKSWFGPAAILAVVVVLGGCGFYFWQSSSKAHLNKVISKLPIPANETPGDNSPAPSAETPVAQAPTPAQPQDPASQQMNRNDMTSQNPPPVAPAASAQKFIVVIQSVPSGARISIDGQDTGMITPSQRTVESGKEISIALRKDGFQYYEKKEHITENGYVLKATLLPMPKMGYINLELMNGGSNPVVFINGQRVEEKLPLRNYAVIAGAPVKIEVHNPFTGLAANQTVTVQANQRVQVNLVLSQRQPSEAK